MSWILPLCDIDEIRDEIADSTRTLDRLCRYTPVDWERRRETVAILQRWLRRLEQQLAEMETMQALAACGAAPTEGGR